MLACAPLLFLFTVFLVQIKSKFQPKFSNVLPFSLRSRGPSNHRLATNSRIMAEKSLKQELALWISPQFWAQLQLLQLMEKLILRIFFVHPLAPITKSCLLQSVLHHISKRRIATIMRPGLKVLPMLEVYLMSIRLQ